VLAGSVEVRPIPHSEIVINRRGSTQVLLTSSHPLASIHAIELSRFEQASRLWRLPPIGAYPQRIADLANALLTTVLETWGRSWTPARPKASYGPVRWTVVDSTGPANPPEKWKVGSSILPLATTTDQRKPPGESCRLWRLTATVTATASSERLSEVPQRLALLIQRHVRVEIVIVTSIAE
jgi:hypothetical protein